MFRAITVGLFNVTTINNKFRELWGVVTGLVDDVKELKRLAGLLKDEAETITQDSAETVIETVAEVAECRHRVRFQ